MSTVRATRVFGPELVTGGTTVLPTPSVGKRWKIEGVFLVNPGASSASVVIEVSSFPAAALPVLKFEVPSQESERISDAGLVINATDRFECEVAALDNVYLTITAFELSLP